MLIPIVYRGNIYSDSMHRGYIDTDKLIDMVKHPQVNPSKENVPVALYGEMVKLPFLNDAGLPRPLGINIETLKFIQLDYDDGHSIDDFIAENKDRFQFVLYTSYSHGYKGECDRFRVIIPLDEPLHCMRMNCYFSKAMDSIFHCDPSAWSRGHMQCIPAIREEGAPYEYYINTNAPLFHIPWHLVDDEERKAVAVHMFTRALENWWSYCDMLLGFEREEPDEATIKMNALRWAQEQFDQCPVGARNNTMFTVLSWLKGKGVTGEEAYLLSPPIGVDNEFDRMVERIFYE